MSHAVADFDLNKIPTSAGVYLMKGEDGTILYVGKAKHLRNRLRNYFSATGDGRAHIRFLVARVRDIETIRITSYNVCYTKLLRLLVLSIKNIHVGK